MKIFSFLRWKFQQSTFEDLCWHAGVILITVSFLRDFDKMFLFAGLCCWMGMFIRMLANHYKKEYEQFKQEQNKLFETIKHSDQK